MFGFIKRAVAIMAVACSILLLLSTSAQARSGAKRPVNCSHINATGDPHCGILTVHAGKATGGYAWNVYGDGRNSHSAGKVTAAWKTFTKGGAHAVCARDCLADIRGRGKNNWHSSVSSCKEASYIWAKVNKKSDQVNAVGYGQSSKAVVSSLPKKAKQANGSADYRGYLGELKAQLHNLDPSRYVTVICSAGLP